MKQDKIVSDFYNLKKISIQIKKYKYIDIALVATIALISILPRIWQLTTHPPLIVDEPANLRDIERIISGSAFLPTEFYWDFSQSFVALYPTVFLIKLFNISNHFFALRLTSVILSVAALIPFYFITKKLTTRLTAFSMTALFSFSYYFLQFSRVGWINMFTIFSGLFMWWLLTEGLRRKNHILIMLSGVFAGLVFNSYKGGYIYLGVALLFLLFKLIKSGFKKRHLISLAATFIIVFIAVSAPWGIKIAQNYERYTLRSRVVSIQNVVSKVSPENPYYGAVNPKEVYIHQTTTSLGAWFFFRPAESGNHESPRYLPLSSPPINIFISVLFWLGLLACIISGKNLAKTWPWILIYLTTVVSGQVLTVHPPNGARGLIMLPAIYIIAGFGLFRLQKKINSKIFTVFTLILCLLFVVADLLFYRYWMSWIEV